jgi:hypothetical protein
MVNADDELSGGEYAVWFDEIGVEVAVVLF